MKDFHWFLIFGAILITPFLPALLRSKCPACKKRKLQQLDTVRLLTEDEPTGFTYVSLFRCDACKKQFKRKKTGAIEESSGDEHKILMQAAVHEVNS